MRMVQSRGAKAFRRARSSRPYPACGNRRQAQRARLGRFSVTLRRDEAVIVPLLEEFQKSRLRRDWRAMRGLLHPEGLLESLAAPGRVLSADELIQAVEDATLHGIYSVKTWRVEPLGRRVGLVDSRVRYRYGSRGFTDEGRSFLAAELDGLIWRMRVFRVRQDLLECFGKHGLGLGL
jgi:hypothetical protein